MIDFIKSAMGFWDVAVNGNDGWICNIFFSALFHINLSTLETDFVTMLPTSEPLGYSRYGLIRYVDGKLVIGPICENKALIYDIDNDSFKEIPLNDYIEDGKIWPFLSMEVCDKKVYLTPRESGIVIVIDIENENVKCIDLWKKLGINRVNGMSFNKSALSQGKIYISSFMLDYFIVLDTKTEEVYKVTVADGSFPKVASVIDGDVWFADTKDNSIKLQNNIIIKTVMDDKNVRNSFENSYKYITKCGNNLYLFPLKSKYVIKFDLISNKYEIVLELPTEFEDEEWAIADNSIKGIRKINEKEVLFYSSYDAKLVKVNMESGQVIVKSTAYSEENALSIEKKLYNLIGFYSENEENDVKKFITMIE